MHWLPRSASPLWGAEFRNTPLDLKQAKDWVRQADDLLGQSSALAQEVLQAVW